MYGEKYLRKRQLQSWDQVVCFVSFTLLPSLFFHFFSYASIDKYWNLKLSPYTFFFYNEGAGKSSLLNILAGRASSHGNLKIEADIRLNNYSVDPTIIEVRQHIAFVAQDDSLQITATPREAIRFSAKLRLSRSIEEHNLDKLTERVISELGLSSCADTIVVSHAWTYFENELQFFSQKASTNIRFLCFDWICLVPTTI